MISDQLRLLHLVGDLGEMTTASPPLRSTAARPHLMMPRPVMYACWMPVRPWMNPRSESPTKHAHDLRAASRCRSRDTVCRSLRPDCAVDRWSPCRPRYPSCRSPASASSAGSTAGSDSEPPCSPAPTDKALPLSMPLLQHLLGELGEPHLVYLRLPGCRRRSSREAALSTTSG